MADPASRYLRLNSPALLAAASHPPLVCVVCGAAVPDLPRIPQLGGLSPTEIHDDWHRKEADRA